MKELLRSFEGQVVGVNVRDATKVAPAVLTEIADDHLVVQAEDGSIHYYPVHAILKVAVAPEGQAFLTGGVFSPKQFRVVVLVNHLVVYQGAVGIGVGF